jgi:hypothetical protein
MGTLSSCEEREMERERYIYGEMGERERGIER